jgi:hypothetical protein
MASPNLGLTIPQPDVTDGPEWAQQVADDLSLIDEHDHTASHGVRIPTAGLNINADLTMGEFNLVEIRTLRLVDQVSTPSEGTDLSIVYSKNGELAYRDASGNEVVITDNGSVAGAVGNITGLVAPASASYSSGTKTITFSQDTAKPAKLNISDIALYEFNNATANPITIKSPASLASPYSLTLLGTLPAASGLMTISPTGVLTTLDATLGINDQYAVSVKADGSGFQTTQLTDAAYGDESLSFRRRKPRLSGGNAAALGEIMIAGTSGNFITNSTSAVPVTNLTGTLVCSGGIIVAELIPALNATASYVSGNSTNLELTLSRDGVAVSVVTVTPNGLFCLPSATFMDFGATAGNHTFTITARSTLGANVIVSNCDLVVYEI